MTEAILVYDDDCGFCTWWAEFFTDRSDLPVVGFEELTPELRDRLPEEYENCSHVVTDERVYSCGASIEEAFSRSNLGEGVRPLVEFLRNFEDYERFRERSYRRVADDRVRWGRLLSKTPPARRDSDDER
jgi:predicted DCC family thiol-disulfide oxidoreductase YuxK